MNWLDRIIIELGDVSVAIIYGFVIIVCVSLIFRDKEGKHELEKHHQKKD